jgi:NADH-quinone oxidoreductase subunit G
VRKAARNGARVAFLNPAHFDHLFSVASELVSAPGEQVADLAAVLGAVADGAATAPHVVAAVRAARVEERHRAVAAALTHGPRRAIWLGALAQRHPRYADLRALAAALAQLTGASLAELAEGANAAGAWLAGAVPHRDAGGRPLPDPGRNAREMLEGALSAYFLHGGIEPWADSLVADCGRALNGAEFVVASTPFASEELKRYAHVLLPIATFGEASGTFVNLEGRWQSFAGAARAPGEARPGWKVLRVLGNELALAGFDYASSEAVRDELRSLCPDAGAAPYAGAHRVELGAAVAGRVADLPMYSTDSLLRRATALQQTPEGSAAVAFY